MILNIREWTCLITFFLMVSYINLYKIILVYEDEPLDRLEAMLWETLIAPHSDRIVAHDKDSIINILRKCDKRIENSGYIYGNIFDLARLCALKGFDTKGASKDMMKKMLIIGKNDTVYIPLLGIRINNLFNTNTHDIKSQHELLEYKYMDSDILREYISNSKHNYTNHLKCCRGRADYIEWLTTVDKIIIDSDYRDANEHDIRRLCYMRSIPISDDMDKMRKDLRLFIMNDFLVCPNPSICDSA